MGAAVWLGLIAIITALFTSITAPMILSRRMDKRHREDLEAERDARLAEKKMEYDRQDQVAEQLREAARLLRVQDQQQREAAEEVARLAALANEQTTAQLAKVLEQGQAIHTLVNSDMTAARQESLNLMRGTLVLLVKAAGDDPSQEDADEITALQERIAKQEQILADRLDAQRRVEADQAAALVAVQSGAQSQGGE